MPRYAKVSVIALLFIIVGFASVSAQTPAASPTPDESEAQEEPCSQSEAEGQAVDTTAPATPQETPSLAEALKGQEQQDKPRRLGPLNITTLGATGLFTMFDAYTLERGAFRAGYVTDLQQAAIRGVSVRQFPLTFSVGLSPRWELFFRTNVLNHTRVGEPQNLSGALLRAAITQPSSFAQTALSNVQNDFFLLPGLPVSGALVGGILPGIPLGTPLSVADPILGRPKNAFQQPAYLLDMPFLGRGGNAYGDTTVGAKFRFNKIKPADPNAPKPSSELEALTQSPLWAASVLGYYRFPSQGAGAFLSDPLNSRLAHGGSAGASELGIFLLGSLYRPQDNKKLSKQEYNDTFNQHINLGYILRFDPKVDGQTLVRRRDSAVISYGFDTLINQYLQAVMEARYDVLVGGGTPNLGERSTVSLTLGPRIYPLGMSRWDCDKDEPQRRFFLSFGAAYRLTVQPEAGDTFSRQVRNGFLFQFNVGRSVLSARDTIACPDPKPVNCETNQEKLRIIELKTSSPTYREGDTLEVNARVEHGEQFNLKYEWTITSGSQVVKRFNTTVSCLRTTLEGLTAGQEYAVVVRASYEYGGETCPGGPQSTRFTVVTRPPRGRLELRSPERVVEGTRATYEAVVSNVPADSVPQYSWQISDESGTDLSSRIVGAKDAQNISVDTEGLGDRILTARVTLGGVQLAQDVINPAQGQTIVMVCPQDLKIVGTNSVAAGLTPRFKVAFGRAPQARPKWSFSWTDKEGQLRSQSAEGVEVDFDTDELAAEPRPRKGVFVREVNAQVRLDGINYPAPGCPLETGATLNVFAPVLFGTNIYRLRANERVKLDTLAGLLQREPDKSLEIRVEGNADPRWHAAYNCRLACRRAHEVKSYLMAQGIAGERIDVFSYGKYRAAGRNKSAWQKDRRVDFIVYPSALRIERPAALCDCPISKPARPKAIRGRKRKR